MTDNLLGNDDSLPSVMHDGERHSPVFDPESVNHYRHMTAYHFALKFVAGADILDYGCGTGYGTNFLLRRGSPRSVAAVDVDGRAIAYSKKTYPDFGDRFDVIGADTVPFSSACFDVVLLFQVLEHVRADSALLGELARVMRPGGRLFITTPNVELTGEDPEHPSNPFHIREYSRASLGALCRSHFTAIEELGVRCSLRIAGRGLGLERLRAYRAARRLWRWVSPPVYLPAVSLADFAIRRDNVPEALDLLFVCTRSDSPDQGAA